MKRCPVKLWSGVMALCTTMAIGLAAQAPPPGSKTGNPTPGTPQPDPPNLADRITVAGCVELAAGQNAGGRGAVPVDPNSPSDSRFVLTKAERKDVVPPGTGTSKVAAAAKSRTFRLSAIDTQLAPFVGTKVEISGEILPATGKSEGPNAGAPALQVEFVQKLAPNCS